VVIPRPWMPLSIRWLGLAHPVEGVPGRTRAAPSVTWGCSALIAACPGAHVHTPPEQVPEQHSAVQVQSLPLAAQGLHCVFEWQSSPEQQVPCWPQLPEQPNF